MNTRCIAKGDEVLLAYAPGERVAGEEHAIVEQVHDASARMSGHRNRDEAGRDLVRRLAFKEIGCVWCCRPVIVMDPDARAEPIGVFPSVCHVVLVGEKDMRDAAGVVEPLYELRRMARRINEEVAARARDEVRVRAEGRARIEPTAPHAVGGSPAERSWLVAAAASFRCVPTRLGTRVPHARPQVVPRMSSAAARRRFCRVARR